MLSDPHDIRYDRIETTRSTACPPVCALSLPVGERSSALRRSCAQSFASRACLRTGQRQSVRAKPFFRWRGVFLFAYSIRPTPTVGVFRILVLLCLAHFSLYTPFKNYFPPPPHAFHARTRAQRRQESPKGAPTAAHTAGKPAPKDAAACRNNPTRQAREKDCTPPPR